MSLFKKKHTQPVQKAEENFKYVEKYVLCDPKKILSGGYSLWYSCPIVRVAYESDTDWKPTVDLPTNVFGHYLLALEKSPYEVSAQEKNRTIYIIKFADKLTGYLFPDIVGPNKCVFGKPENWVFHINPKINNELVQAIKTYSR